MDSFNGKIAVVTGGGTGMGRELCIQLVKEGCAVATCDVMMDNLNETKALCNEAAPDVAVTLHQCDVSSEAEMLRFRDEVVAAHGDKINLVFNNAGIGGGGSVTSEETRDEWERTFNVCWYGVYYSCRAFMPHVIAADEGWFINTSRFNARRRDRDARAARKHDERGCIINGCRSSTSHGHRALCHCC